MSKNFISLSFVFRNGIFYIDISKDSIVKKPLIDWIPLSTIKFADFVLTDDELFVTDFARQRIMKADLTDSDTIFTEVIKDHSIDGPHKMELVANDLYFTTSYMLIVLDGKTYSIVKN